MSSILEIGNFIVVNTTFEKSNPIKFVQKYRYAKFKDSDQPLILCYKVIGKTFRLFLSNIAKQQWVEGMLTFHGVTKA